MDKRAEMAQFRRAVQFFMNTVEDEEILQEVATVAPAYAVGIAYKPGEVFAYGLNSVGDPQLWRVVQGHTSQADWTPDTVPALYKAIGLTPEGVPIWAQPLGAHDAYMKGDRVEHKGQMWESTCDGNVWEPGVYGWKVVA